jgi:DNA-binding SARP family transcriptional activator
MRKMALSIAVLGPLRVALNEGVLLEGGGGKPWALLAYLAVESDRPHTRERLAALLWPEQPEQNARQNLRWALNTLRRAIGDAEASLPYLLISRETLQLNIASAIDVDVAQFRDSVALPDDIEALQRAVDLYRGDLLDGILLADSEPFEEWLAQTRARLQHQVVEALARLVADAEQRRDSAMLERYARRWLVIDPWCEIAHRGLLRALLWSGRRSAALQHYEATRALLANDLGIEVEPETQQLYEQIRLGEQPVPRAEPSAPPEVVVHPDRQRMIERVGQFWVDGVLAPSRRSLPELTPDFTLRPGPGHPLPADAHRDHTQIIAAYDAYEGDLLVLGGPGAGKTHLLLELAYVLLQRAAADPTCPIPVVFNLAFWDARSSTLDEWLIAELQARYQVPSQLASQWVASNQILPLLDGFDEVGIAEYEHCLTAICRFRAERWAHGMLICCRTSDGVALAERVLPRGIIEVLPLSRAQVDHFLAQGTQPTALRQLLDADESWYTLTTTPLLLRLLSVSIRDAHLAEQLVSGGAQVAQQQIFASYVQAMLERSGGRNMGDVDVQRKWLHWLARNMTQHQQSMVFVEGLQPSWLPDLSWRRWYAFLELLLLGIGFALLVGLDAGLRLWLNGVEGGLWRGLSTALTIGIAVGGSLGAVAAATLHRTEQLQRTRWQILRQQAFERGGVAGLTFGLSVALLFDTALSYGVGITVGLIFFALTVLLGREQPIAMVEHVGWSMETARRRAWVSVVVGLVCGMLFVIGGNAPMGLVMGLAIGVVTLACSGLTSGMLPRQARPTEQLRQSAQTSLRVSVLLGSSVGLLFVLVHGLAMLWQADMLAGIQFGFTNSLHSGIVNALAPALIGVAIGLLFFGGLACLQHAVLRLLLWRAGLVPLRLVRFLEHAASLLLLRKVGSGYMFMHGLLQEHCAQDEVFLKPNV